MIPQVGPVLYNPRGLAGVTLLTGTSVGPIGFSFPRPVFVTGLMLLARDPAEQAALVLRIQDETFQDIILDGQGGTFTAGGLAMSGQGPRYFPLQRPVIGGDSWYFTVTNEGPNTATIASLTLMFTNPNTYRELAGDSLRP